MNWLAHLRLAPAQPEVRLGALFADFARADELAALPPRVRAGIVHHRAIDAFTDAHPVFRRSRARIGGPARRFSGVLVDVFYDHFLARDWHRHGDGSPLQCFTAEHYRLLAAHEAIAPAALRRAAPHMAAQDWLASYATLAGIDDVVRRMDGRLSRPGPLAAGSAALQADYAGFEDDFAEFFPAVTAFAAALPDGRADELT